MPPSSHLAVELHYPGKRPATEILAAGPVPQLLSLQFLLPPGPTNRWAAYLEACSPNQAAQSLSPDQSAPGAGTSAIPATQAETGPEEPWHNRLIFGENLAALRALANHRAVKGQVKLVYIDPPFATQREFQGKNQAAWADTLDGPQFLEFLRQRLLLLRELLADDGSLYVHMDYRLVHYVKVLLDEIMGRENFRNEIVVKRATKNLQNQFAQVVMLNTATDSILWYSKHPEARFRPPTKKATPRQQQGSWASFYNQENRPTMRYPLFGKNISRGQWKWSQDRALRAAANYQTYLEQYAGKMTLKEYWQATGRTLEFLRPSPRTGSPQYWVEPREEAICDTNWLDIPAYQFSSGYPTQKSEALLERIIKASSQPEDLVLDCFCGSGTTLVVAQRLGRRWIGVDWVEAAINITAQRLRLVAGQEQESPMPPVGGTTNEENTRVRLESKAKGWSGSGIKPTQYSARNSMRVPISQRSSGSK